METWLPVASAQSGVISGRQLHERGLSPAAITRLVSSGTLHRHRRSVYVVPGWPGGWRQELWVAVLGPGKPVISHRAAGALWGLDAMPPDIVEVTCLRGCKPIVPGLHRVRELAADNVTTRDGLPVTTVLQTLLDLATVVDGNVVERAMESAFRLELTAPEEVAKVDALRRRGRSGPPLLLDVLSRRPPDAVPTESDAETLFLQLARMAGIDEPVRQYVLVGRGGRIRLDFAWPRVRLAIEIDGAATHAGAEALGRDLRRQNRIVLGWLVLRFTWEDVARYPDQVIEVLREAWAFLIAGPVPPSVRR
jgi:very-short-patch-repair endonuclease